MLVLLAIRVDSIDPANMSKFEKPESGSTVLILGKVWPEPGSSAAGTRMIQLIRLLLKNGFKVTFATTAGDSDYNALNQLPEVNTVEIRLNDPSFDTFISDLQPSVVIFDRFMTEEQFGWRVAEQCPDTIRILNTEDLHSLRFSRESAWESEMDFKPELMFDHEITKREIASICRSDLSLIISEAEMNLLLNHFPVEPTQLHYLPFLFDPLNPEFIDSLPGFEQREGFSTIGNFLHKPNRNSVRFLKNEIWPLIRNQLHNANLYVYGAYPAQQDLELHAPDEGFHIMGRVEDAKQAISATKVLLAPLKFGAGLKGKLFDAMQAGTPSVTTSIGAEGIASEEEWCGFVTDNPVEFAEWAVQLVRCQSDWATAQKKGFQILNDRFECNKFTENLLTRLMELQLDLKAHRKKLFTGSMLMHHTLASHRYMSKWIEEKEKMR